MKFQGTPQELKEFLNEQVKKEDSGLKVDVNDGLAIGTDKDWDRYEQDGVMADVNFKTEKVEFHDAGNYMEVPMELIRKVSKDIEIK